MENLGILYICKVFPNLSGFMLSMEYSILMPQLMIAGDAPTILHGGC